MVWFGDSRIRLHRFLVLGCLAAACSPYDSQKGEFNAGAVDAANFAAPYKGANASSAINGYVAGLGTFTEVGAYAGNQPVGYYSFPFSSTQLAETDPLLIYADASLRKPSAPNAYAFDPAPPSPFPASQSCIPPRNYVYNEELDEVHLDQQYNIFTQLPIATEPPGQMSTFSYFPVVAEVAVSANGMNCQSLKSEATLMRTWGTPPLTGNLLLWAIIDPSAAVLRVGQTADIRNYRLPDGSLNPAFSRGQNVQKWGWFQQYYLAYIDGGYIPTQPVTVSVRIGNRTVQAQTAKMKTQSLYVPNAVLTDGPPCGAAGTPCQPGQVCASDQCQTCTSSGARACPAGFRCGTSAPVLNLCNAGQTPGSGGDVLEYARRDTGQYSPVCEVRVYNAGTIGTRPRSLSELPRSAGDIRSLDPTVDNPTTSHQYVYCPQVD